MNRFWHAAHIIDPGASNPLSVARCLISAIKEAKAENVDPNKDPACRLICYQLYHILDLWNYDHDTEAFRRDEKIIKEKAHL